ncbi:hypothetical protein M440DRAFT_1399757 [Trichoderma longibrachiatum ATCC 18648]|uniref:Uncharacterized protein n=1 Tax=Trichoderma longibrachiatum ATCC 18648 TaxID=983965 RepID=A0A2T4CAQ0_TRILO|nr:hypothetical protein M440DRAFT_1399757 [Trichoderma longibrachiatum ATCC 18648]
MASQKTTQPEGDAVHYGKIYSISGFGYLDGFGIAMIRLANRTAVLSSSPKT